MKSSKSSVTSKDEAEGNDTGRISRDTLKRPPLRKSSLGATSDARQSAHESAGHAKGGAELETQDGGAQPATVDAVSNTQSEDDSKEAEISDERLVKLRDAMNTRLLMQQRMRRSQGALKSEGNSPRVAAIQEEAMTASAQSMNAILARTSSHESTESSRTVRVGKDATPGANTPLRTPSYPFPYVPGTPKGRPTQVHQPFTTLSPTASFGPFDARTDTDEADQDMFPSSIAFTRTNSFVPPSSQQTFQEDPRYPTPNLYDLILQLNAEPGLEQWWAAVTNIMHDNFRADRATLTVPRDVTELENVPWGQKATFNMSGADEYVPRSTVLEQVFDAKDPYRNNENHDVTDNVERRKLHSERLRPRLESRHSYAGHGREEKDVRPQGPQRTATHAAGITPAPLDPRLPTHRFDSTSTQRYSSLGNPDYSSASGDVDFGPYAEVFPTLRSLDHEIQPLIESDGVSRLLDRGCVVTVTRDYLSAENSTHGGIDTHLGDATPTMTPRPSVVAELGNYRKVFASDNAPPLRRDYEEYEQVPSSPWSQSPAPSPAIQEHEDMNPFFASDVSHIEDSFNPAASPKDYSQLGQVEAIGIDRASTIIHIPLIHPTISQPMPPTKSFSQHQRRKSIERSNTLDPERRTPVAILSILTSTVPYPPNLAHSLELLGPHLATSFATSQQFSSSKPQNVTIRHRRTDTGQTAIKAPMTIVPTSLEDIMNADMTRLRTSHSTTATSPSEFSATSPYSNASSIVGTPGWDPASHGWVANKSAAGTPALTGSEMVDNYFEAKKRSAKKSLSSSSAQAQSPSTARSTKKASHVDRRQSTHKSVSPTTENSKASLVDAKLRADHHTKQHRSLEKEPSPTRSPGDSSAQQHSIANPAGLTVKPAIEKRHSQLHSYGADFKTSFGASPAMGFDLPTPSEFGHARKTSYPEGMPPPSERLLRTIIDSVPVQIFTAEPESGKMTWVNSKFMVYRGLEALEILNDPWQAIHPDDREEFMSTWHRSLRTAQQLQQKVRLQRFDGNYRWFYVRAAPLLDKKQKIVHWIGTMMDFHDQNLAQENAAKQHETAASEAKYRALANSSPQVVFAANKTRGIIFCNTQWVHFSGQTENQARGVGFMDHVHPDDLVKCKLPVFEQGSELPRGVPTSVPPEMRRRTSSGMESSTGSSETERAVLTPGGSPLTPHMPQRRLSELATTGILKVSRDAEGRTSYSTEVRLKSKEGEYRWHLVRILLAEPLLQKDGEEETWYGTCTDISDHKALERDLKQTMDEKSRFLSNMSHEIRTPLNGITGMVNFLIDSRLSTEQLEHVNIIRASTEGLRGLINDILDLSKAEAGMIQLNMDWFYARSLIEEVNDLTSAMAIDKGIELNYLVEEDVPTQIKGDRFRIRQILLNVIGNAIKFTQRGEVFIHCSTYPSDDYQLEDNELFIKFEVIDTGRGFSDEEAELLFKRFSQIDGSSTRQHGGTGLGLVISRQLAQLHGGDMRARSVPNEGSTFTCLIKATIPSQLDEPPTPMLTPGGVNIPILPLSPGPGATPLAMQSMMGSIDGQARPASKLAFQLTQSPSPYASSPDMGRDSPAISSAGSEHSVLSTAKTSVGSLRSERSSASSFAQHLVGDGAPMKLTFPSDSQTPLVATDSRAWSSNATDTLSMRPRLGNRSRPSSMVLGPSGNTTAPPMYSILVVCPLKYSREATVSHIAKTVPKNIPHQITAKDHVPDIQSPIDGNNPVIFTHIVVVVRDVEEITTLMDRVLLSQAHQATSIVIITDLAQKRQIMEKAPNHNYEKLASEHRLIFIFKPLKPSRFAAIFDPQKEREMSYDRNQDSAQQVALTQKQVFEEVTKRLGNRDKRVLLVEDNRTNQLVILKFLAKVSINVDTAIDGVECTEKAFSKPFGYYSIILCDLHMPNKDGYQTCREIRKWERDNHHAHLPIVALSANVLGDVHDKCVTSGFNSYLTKPVDFKELGTVLMTFMDPRDPSKAHEFMKMKRRKGGT